MSIAGQHMPVIAGGHYCANASTLFRRPRQMTRVRCRGANPPECSDEGSNDPERSPEPSPLNRPFPHVNCTEQDRWTGTD